MEYKVVWQIDIEAETPEAAARLAFEAVRGHHTTATVFEVYSGNGCKVVDVAEGKL